MLRKPIVIIALWLAAFGLGLLADIYVADFSYQNNWGRKWMWGPRTHTLTDIAKFPGDFKFTLIVIALLLIFYGKNRWQAAGLVLGSAGVCSLNQILKWVVGRRRPVVTIRPFELDLFAGGFQGLFGAEKNLSFPSGHAALAFATASSLALLLPRGKWLFYAVATMVACERVAENAHYVSDSIAGAAVGILSTYIVVWIFQWWTKPKPAPSQSGPTELRLQPEPMTEKPFLSLVIPCYNEQENVPTLLSRIDSAMLPLGKPYEVILVDDGSKDDTPRLLAEGMQKYPWLRVLRMAKNGGQSAAFEAGFTAARADLIATIDADLQNDPEEIPRLVPMLDQDGGYDMITGWRKDRQDTNFRRWQSRQANRIRNWISQDNINDSACSLKLYRSYTIKGLKLFNGAHRFFPALVKMRGYKVLEVPVKHSARFAGTAKYGFSNRALRAFIDLIGIRWMKERYVRYTADEVLRPASEVSQ